MLASIRGLTAATLFLGAALPAMASAQTTVETDTGNPDTDATPESGFTISGNVALTTDYRFRGISFSGGDPAVQGGIDIGHESGFYVGTWASSLDVGPSYGELELDLYAGYAKEFDNGVTVDAGLLYYVYPTEDTGANVNYFEPYASAGFALGPASATVGVAYTWDQASTGGENFYVYTDLEAGVPDTGITLTGHVGYTDGVFSPPIYSGLSTDRTAFDYSIGASATYGILSLGVSYTGVGGPSVDGLTDDAVVATLSASF